MSSPAVGLLRALTVDVVTRIKAEIRLVGFWHNTYAQNTLRAWVATRLAEPMIDGEDLFDFSRIDPVADRLVELAKANHARLAASQWQPRGSSRSPGAAVVGYFADARSQCPACLDEHRRPDLRRPPSERRRTVGLTVDLDGSPRLHAPAGISPDVLATWAWSKRGWVFRKLAGSTCCCPPAPARYSSPGEGFDYLGRHYRLQLTDDPPGAAVKLERGRLRMPRTRQTLTTRAEAVMRWYRQRGAIWLPRRIRPWAERMGLRPGDLDIRDLGYRWGSLGKSDRLNIHWAAMQLPVSLLDYVIVHELAHIEQTRHTPAFWATVERALPDYDQRRNPPRRSRHHPLARLRGSWCRNGCWDAIPGWAGRMTSTQRFVSVSEPPSRKR